MNRAHVGANCNFSCGKIFTQPELGREHKSREMGSFISPIFQTGGKPTRINDAQHEVQTSSAERKSGPLGTR
jgi:hypothetical protein